MSEVAELFEQRSNLSAIAREMRCPVGTVFSWKKKGDIPKWRRLAVLGAAQRLQLSLSDATVAYLAQVD